MATHTLEPTRPNLHGHFSRDLSPVLTINSGDTVVFRTLDAGWHTDAPPFDGSGPPPLFAPRNPDTDSGHALCGPVFINGAEPGMTLEIEIGDIVPGTWGWNGAGGWAHEVNARLGLTDTPKTALRWVIDKAAQTAHDQHGRTVDLSPFLGVMGMPPDEPGILPTAPPRPTGGNLDCKELTSGTRLFLPIAVHGGLFSAGDGHAKQSDGEVSVTAIECPMERAALTFHLHPHLHITTPRARTSEGWITLGFSPDLDEAAFIALDAMLGLMQEQYPKITSRGDALALASVVVDLRVTQIVNGVKGVHAVLGHNALRGAS